MARVSVWVMRLIGVAAAAYVGVLAAGQIPNELNRSSRLPGTHYADWGAAFVLGAGVVIAVFVTYQLLRASTPVATLRRLAIGLGALGLWFGAVIVLLAPTT